MLCRFKTYLHENLDILNAYSSQDVSFGVTIITKGILSEYDTSYFSGGERNMILPKLMFNE